MHCDLDDGQQFIFSGNDVRMVDFGCAVPHRCPGATPTLHGEIPTGCRELVMLERNYGIHSGDSFPIVNAPVAKLPTGNPLQVLARRFGGIMG
ncbi:hypothetical protein C8R46DRAFT_1113626 [Mycena filopes]|nr:hypothetical protein C8R46DRAFT_1113626 [Mycena filopes]